MMNYATTGAVLAFRPRLGLMLGVSDISGFATARSSAGEDSGSSSESDFSSLGTRFLVGMAFPQSSASLRDWLHSLPISRRAARTLAAELFVPDASFASSALATARYFSIAARLLSMPMVAFVLIVDVLHTGYIRWG